MEIKLLDKRMRGYGSFKYAMSLERDVKKFVEIRHWFYNTYGASIELDIWERFKPNDIITDWIWSDKWSWERGEFGKTYRCKIYIKSDEELVWAKTRWA